MRRDRRLGLIALVGGFLLMAVGCSQPERTNPEDLAGAIQEAAPGATIHLMPNLTYEPVVIDKPLTLIGAPGAVIAAPSSGVGISIDHTADVTLDGISVAGGEIGILVKSATNVAIRGTTVERAQDRGIQIRDGQAIIDGCVVRALTGPYARGVEVVNAESRPPTVVRGCSIEGPVWEGVASRLARATVEGNHVSGSKQRGIAVTEMSTGTVRDNVVSDVAGNAYFCGDMSHCTIIGNSAKRVTPGEAPMRSSQGHGVVVQYHSAATIDQLTLEEVSGRPVFTSVDGTARFPTAVPNPLIWFVIATIVIALSVLGYQRLTRPRSDPALRNDHSYT